MTDQEEQELAKLQALIDRLPEGHQKFGALRHYSYLHADIVKRTTDLSAESTDHA